MRRVSVPYLLVAALILVGAGCSSNKGKIEGTRWSSQAATVKGVKVPSGFLKLDFAKDGSLIYRVGPQAYKGKYGLGLGDFVTLTFDQELAGLKNHVETVTIERNELTMTDTDGTNVTFSKVP